MLSGVKKFNDSINNITDAYCDLNNGFDKEYVETVKQCSIKSLIMYKKPIDVYDSIQVRNRNSKYKFNWDVSGSNKYKMDLKRLNLSAVEGIHSACIPIVNKNNTPGLINKFSIDYNSIFNDPGYLKKIDYEKESLKMINILLDNNFYTYNSVKKQIEKIINKLAG
jgi:hypothetical protein